MQARKSGFTLIELLVVIAIIAILAAILFPVFATAREKARQTSCASNEKQLGLAMIQYVEDYDEMFPAGYLYPTATTGWPVGSGCSWSQQLYPYVKSKGAFLCPDDASNSGAPLLSYTYNWNLTGPSSTGYNGCGNGLGEKLASLASPSLTVCLCEVALNGTFDPTNLSMPSGAYAGYAINYWAVSDYVTGILGTIYPAARSGWTVPTPINIRHGVGTNFLACDGHVKFLRPEKVSSGFSPNGPGYAQGAYSSPWGAATTDNMQINTGTATLTFSTT